MKTKNTNKITSCIMSISILCSCFYLCSNQNYTAISTVSALTVLPDELKCELDNHDFVISEDEVLNIMDLKRHGLKISRWYSYIEDTSEGPYKQDICYINNIPTSECEIQFPEKLQSGKNVIKIVNGTGIDDSIVEDSLQINVTFSAEDSEKKDLAEISDIIYGDLDSNGKVDSSDLIRLSQYMLGQVTLTAAQYISGDTDGDKEVDIADLPTLRQYIMNDEIILGHVKKSFQDIVLVMKHTDWTGDCIYSGFFYDKEGNEYKYDLSQKYRKRRSLPDELLIDEITKLYCSPDSHSIKKMNTEDISYINSLIYKINPEAGFDSKLHTDGISRFTLFGVKHNKDYTDEFVKVYSFGCYIDTPNDENAAELYRYVFEDVFKR